MLPLPNYEFVNLSDPRTPSRTKLLRDREICLGQRNLSGQRISTEIVGGEGSEYVMIDGEQVVAPPDMGYHDITHAFLWTRGKKHDLGTLPNHKNSTVYCINAAGQVVGTANNDVPVLWQHGKAQILPTPSDVGEARWINAEGIIVGQGAGACLWRHGKLHSLGGLGGRGSAAYCINDRGDVVGYGLISDYIGHAFLYRDGKMRDLGTLSGCVESYAHSINNMGDIVGEAVTLKADARMKTLFPEYPHPDQSPTYYAVLWHNGTCINLNAFVPDSLHIHLYNALGINDVGDIFGEAYDRIGKINFMLKRLPGVYKTGIFKLTGKRAEITTTAIRR